MRNTLRRSNAPHTKHRHMADNNILNRLDGLKLKFEEIGQQMTDPEVIGDMKKFVQLNKEYKELKPIIETSDRYRTAVNNLREAKDILANEKDEDLREMAREEVAELEPSIGKLEEEIKLLLIPKDPQDEKNAIVEIRQCKRYTFTVDPDGIHPVGG